MDGFFNTNTGNAIKIFDGGGLKVTRAVPEKQSFWCKLDFILFYLKSK